MNPWLLEVLTVRDGSHDSGERRTVVRDVERGLLIRLRVGAYVERTSFEAMTPEDQHIVRLRALAAVSSVPPVFSHWSAAVLLGLPVLRSRLRLIHTTVAERRERGQEGVSGHLFAVTPAEVQPVGELLITTVPRTVVDIAGAAPFDEGVMVADAALRSGVPREALEEALVVAGPRRAHLRIEHVVAFAHPGAESAAESGSRVLLLRMGIEPPVLQWAVRLTDGSVASVDFWFASVEVGGETDGDTKYLNTALAPDGAGPVLVKEKRREDDLRTRMRAMARWGWAQSRSLQLLRPILQRVGVVPATPRATLADYIAAARGARPRFIPRRPQVQR